VIAMAASTVDPVVEHEVIERLWRMGQHEQWDYMRWISNPKCESGEGEYCLDCVVIQCYVNRNKDRRRKRRHRERMTRVCGYNDYMEMNHTPYCERCGVLLYFSPTSCWIEEEIRYLKEIDTKDGLDVREAAVIHNMMTCGGEYDYKKEKWWPLLGPELVRLLGV